MVGMPRPWMLIRNIAIIVAICLFTAAASSAFMDMFRRRMQTSKIGDIDRGIRAITPDIQRRDTEVEELTRP